jgi:predicted nucleic acid-binding protein
LILLDTSVLSMVLRRREPGPAERAVAQRLEAYLQSGERVAIPAVVLQELLSGIRQAALVEEIKTILLRGYPVVTATLGDHLLAADVVSRCRQKGIAVSSMDALIAAIAMNARARLFTTDEDFGGVAAVVSLKLVSSDV